MNPGCWELLQGAGEAQAVAWLVRVPGRPEARFVSLDRGHAEQYAARLHGTIHSLVEPRSPGPAASNGCPAVPGGKPVGN
jgi:hypothetical protein